MQHLSIQHRRTIMNKFRRFLFRISAKVYLKIDYFARLKSSKSPSAGAQPPDPRLDSITRECAKTLFPLNNLVDADAWQYWSKYVLLPVQKPFPRH